MSLTVEEHSTTIITNGNQFTRFGLNHQYKVKATTFSGTPSSRLFSEITHHCTIQTHIFTDTH